MICARLCWFRSPPGACRTSRPCFTPAHPPCEQVPLSVGGMLLWAKFVRPHAPASAAGEKGGGELEGNKHAGGGELEMRAAKEGAPRASLLPKLAPSRRASAAAHGGQVKTEHL